MERYVIGVDGGGTKTAGALATLDGVIVATAETGSTNHYSNPIETVRKNLSDLFKTLLGNAPVQPAVVAGIGLGMAGVDRPDDHKLMSGIISELLPQAPFVLDNDGVIALRGGADKPLGIIVISGTGSICLGLNGQGQRARAGGWGYVLGDEGSGYTIALKGLKSVVRAHDGRVAATALTALVTAHLGIADAVGILGWIKEVNAAKDKIAALSRLVFEAAEAGDATAQGILEEEAAELALAVKAVSGKLFAQVGSSEYEVVVAGGNLRNSKRYFDLFAREVEKVVPGLKVVHPRGEPVDGAVKMALELVTKA